MRLLIPGEHPLHITVHNLEMDYAIETLQAHWQLDGGPVHTCTVSEFTVYPNLLYPTFRDRFTHADPLVLPAPGLYDLKVWTSMPGGYPDPDPSNDTLVTEIRVVEALPPQHVMMFYGTHVECFPCGTYGEATIRAVLDSFPNTVHLASASDGSPDPYEVIEGQALNELYMWPFTGHPAFVFDLYAMPFMLDMAAHMFGEVYRTPGWRLEYRSPVEVTVEDLAFDTDTRVLTGEIRARFWADHSGALAVNAIITEDSVYGPQDGVDGGFTHHRHVLRSMTGGVLGVSNLIPPSVSAGEEYIYGFSDTLALDVDPAHVYVAGIVQRDEALPLDREILNSGEARLGAQTSIGMHPTSREGVYIHPNPANEVMHVIASRAGMGDLLDGQGRVVQRLSLREGDNIVPVQELAGGVYVLRVRTTEGWVSCQRVMVRR